MENKKIQVEFVMRSGKTQHMVKIEHFEFLVSFERVQSPLSETRKILSL